MKIFCAQFILLPLLMLQNAYAAEGAAAKPCVAAVHHEFDFWIGDWIVTEHGKPAGTNRIDRLLDGCALFENWVGVEGSRGHSLNFYDPRRAVWQQTWVDAAAGALNLTGHFANGHMVLSGKSADKKTGKLRVDRLTWTPNADGTVRQLWDQSLDEGKTWQVIFDGLYRRKAP
jgi:hypothetical protein